MAEKPRRTSWVGATVGVLVSTLAVTPSPTTAATDSFDSGLQVWLSVVAPPDLDVLSHVVLDHNGTDLIATCTPAEIEGAVYLRENGERNFRCAVPEPGDYTPVLTAPAGMSATVEGCYDYYGSTGWDDQFARVADTGLDMVCRVTIAGPSVRVAVFVEDDGGPIGANSAPAVLDDGEPLPCVPDPRVNDGETAIWCDAPGPGNYTPTITDLAGYTTMVGCVDEDGNETEQASVSAESPVAACRIDAAPPLSITIIATDIHSGIVLRDNAGTDVFDSCTELAALSELSGIDDRRVWHCGPADAGPYLLEYDSPDGELLSVECIGDVAPIRCLIDPNVVELPEPATTIPDTGPDDTIEPATSLPPTGGGTQTEILAAIAALLCILGSVAVRSARAD